MKELIESGAIDELVRLKAERDQLRERLGRLESLQEQVDPRVVQRVAEDYRKRLAAADQRAMPLMQKARQAYALLRKRIDELTARLEAIRLDREEVELRHRLGEYDDRERSEKLAAIEENLAEIQAQRNECEALRERFLAAVDAEADLLAQVAPAVSEAASSTFASSTQPIRPPPGGDLGLPPTRPVPLAEREIKPATSGSTVVLKTARFVPQTREAGRVPVPLVLRNYRIGSSETCDIRIGDSEVAAHQADLLVGPDGFTLADRGANGQTRVNGEVVERKLLRDGDAVEFGRARFLFREG